jgi:hypothetical protein
MPRTPTLFTAEQHRKLLANGAASAAAIAVDGNTPDHQPVVKLFLPEGAATWLLSEIDPNNEDCAFGLCDLGLGEPELGSVSLAELRALRTRQFKLPVERDLHFTAKWTLGQYAEKAHRAGSISAIRAD